MMLYKQGCAIICYEFAYAAYYGGSSGVRSWGIYFKFKTEFFNCVTKLLILSFAFMEAFIDLLLVCYPFDNANCGGI